MNIKTLALALAAAAIATAAQAYPQDWQALDHSPDGSGALEVLPRVQHDAQTNSRRLWERLTSTEAQTQGIAFYVTYVQINCDGQTSRSLTAYAYGPGGGIVQEQDNPTAWERAIPGSLQDEAIDYACAR